LFDVDFSKLTGESIVVALGHAFFTLSLGMGAIMAYGAYMPKGASIGKTVLTVAFLDTLIALVAGLVIFPIVFANDMAPSAGPGLLFQTLPVAFANMPGGTLFGTLFFILVAFAALSSAISLGEPVVAWAVEKAGVSRAHAATWIGIITWILGIGTVLSFNLWAEYKVFGKTFFDVLDFLTANIMLPLGGLLIALFVGWSMRESDFRKESDLPPAMFKLLRYVLMFIAPAGVLYIFANGLGLV